MNRLSRFFTALMVSPLVLFGAAQASYFPDVPDTDTHKSAIEFLYKLSVVDGNPDGTFAPKKLLNRAEFAKLVVVAENGDPLVTPTVPCFKDVPVTAWYAPYVCRAKELGYMKGENGAGEYFRPDQTLNMAEILAVMDRQFQWDTPEADAQSPWYSEYIDVASSKNVVVGQVAPEKSVERDQFAEIMARSLVVYDLDNQPFSSAKQYDEYLSEDTVSASDCIAGEIFDSSVGACKKDCTIAGACEDTQASVDQLNTQIEDPANKFQDSSSENVIATYKVTGDTLTLEGSIAQTDPAYSKVNTTAYHEQVWKIFVSLVPQDQRKEITSFQIFTDGEGNSLAAVQQSSDPKKWTLSVDLKDSFTTTGVIQTEDLKQTLIHEFAHIVTLRLGQMRDTSSLTFPEDMSDEDIKKSLSTSCKTYFDGDSCALPDSYLFAYYTTFWKNIIKDHPTSAAVPPTNMDDAVTAFYNKYANQFLTEYAATNPEEDMAESFVFFVVQDKPTGNSITDQKMKFYWKYPELIVFRTFIRNRL